MKVSHWATAFAVALVLIPMTVPASAFGRGCARHATECYEQVRRPAYRVEQRRVVVRPARRHIVREPAVVSYRNERVMVRPSRVRHVHVRAKYKWVNRKVMIRPARVHHVKTRPVTRLVRKTVVVSPAHTKWVQKGLFRRKKCKVHVPARTRTVLKRVVVQPSRTVRRVSPAVYVNRPTRVMVAPASTRKVVEPAVYRNVRRRVVVKPASRRVVHTPAVTEVRSYKVRTRGERMWVRTRH